MINIFVFFLIKNEEKLKGDTMVGKEEFKENIKQALANVKPWQRIPTTAPGVFLIKAPSKGHGDNLMIEINPVNSEGKPVKRRGLFLTNEVQLDLFRDCLSLESVSNLLCAVTELNGNKNANIENGEKLAI